MKSFLGKPLILFQTTLQLLVISFWGEKCKLEGNGADFATTAAEIPLPPPPPKNRGGERRIKPESVTSVSDINSSPTSK